MKNTSRLALLILYLAAMIAAILVVIKPGASIFYLKQRLSPEKIISFEGDAFSYPHSLNPLLFPTEEMLLYEGDKQLQRTYPADVVEQGRGRYAIASRDRDRFNLLFSASDNSNPLTNGRQYTLYLHMPFLSRTTGISILLIGLLGLAWFGNFVRNFSTSKELPIAHPRTLWSLFNAFLDDEFPRVIRPIKDDAGLDHSRSSTWAFLATLTTAAAFFYVLMEWIFFVTKPSFMDLMGGFEKFEVFLFSGLGISLASLALIGISAGADFLVSKFRTTTLFIFLGSLVPTFLLTTISLLLVDNFTYTIFKFGIVSTSGAVRYAYGVVYLIIFIYLNTRILGWMGLRGSSVKPVKIPRIVFVFLASLLLVTGSLALIQVIGHRPETSQVASHSADGTQSSQLPNVILFGSDGLNATNMSLYGYERDTTPVLRSLSSTSLLAENAFTNASSSAGAITSLLTGKLPAETRVVYPPNILRGNDSSQHLPGILRSAGYYTAELAVPHYIDAESVNMVDGFVEVNGRVKSENQAAHLAKEVGFGNSAYFTSLMSNRISDRLLHIFFIREMQNPYKLVTKAVDIQKDEDQMDRLSELIRETEQPVFAHVHLMGTHGPFFSPKERKFSAGQSQDEEWMTDFYDDSILAYDGHVERLLTALDESGELDNTLLVLYSDHPMQFNPRWRLPLMFHFPRGKISGSIKGNVQNLDIAATILDYLGIDQPTWMQGQSLIREDEPENELIFSTGTSLVTRIEQSRLEIESARIQPPFYQFSFFNVINCHKWYWLDLNSLEWQSGEVPGHTQPCPAGQLLSFDQIQAGLLEHLSNNGFDISTIPPP